MFKQIKGITGRLSLMGVCSMSVIIEHLVPYHHLSPLPVRFVHSLPLKPFDSLIIPYECTTVYDLIKMIQFYSVPNLENKLGASV